MPNLKQTLGILAVIALLAASIGLATNIATTNTTPLTNPEPDPITTPTPTETLEPHQQQLRHRILQRNPNHPTTATLPPRNNSTTPITINSTHVEYYFYEYTEYIRNRRNLSQLNYSEQLAIPAAAHSAHMVNIDHFAHTSPNGTHPAMRLRATARCYQSEIIGGAYIEKPYEFPANMTANEYLAKQAVDGFMASHEGHRSFFVKPKEGAHVIAFGVYVNKTSPTSVGVMVTGTTCYYSDGNETENKRWRETHKDVFGRYSYYYLKQPKSNVTYDFDYPGYNDPFTEATRPIFMDYEEPLPASRLEPIGSNINHSATYR